MEINLVAVTACVSGVAHTYMAAELLEKLCHQEKWNVKIETQGALGIENNLAISEIECANVVLLITDIEIHNPERFQGIRTIKTSINTFLLQPQKVLEAVRRVMGKPIVHIEVN